MSTYKRKYYLHRCIKKAGYKVALEAPYKTICVKQSQVDSAKQDKYLAELQREFNYGVQLINPLF